MISLVYKKWPIFSIDKDYKLCATKTFKENLLRKINWFMKKALPYPPARAQ